MIQTAVLQFMNEIMKKKKSQLYSMRGKGASEHVLILKILIWIRMFWYVKPKLLTGSGFVEVQ